MTKTLSEIIDFRFGYETGIGTDIPAEGPLAQILSRRSHRRYADQPVPDALLDVLLACAQSASAKSDLQQYSIVLVKDAGKQQAITDLIPSMPWIANAPVFMVYCGDIRRAQRVSALRGHDNVNNTLDSFMNAAVDAALAMQCFILAAEAEGLGCCPISAVRAPIDEIGKILELPNGVFPMAGLCVGYPAGEGYMTMRLPPKLVVHNDRYDDSAFEAEMTAYSERREARFPTTADRQMYTDRFGASDDYGWAENTARRLTARERERFKPYLQEHGFDLD